MICDYVYGYYGFYQLPRPSSESTRRRLMDPIDLEREDRERYQRELRSPSRYPRNRPWKDPYGM